MVLLITMAFLNMGLSIQPASSAGSQSTQYWALLMAGAEEPVASQDAQYMWHVLYEHYAFDGIYYLDVRWWLSCVDAVATKENFRSAITDWLATRSDANDVIFIFSVSHGGGYNSIKNEIEGGEYDKDGDEGNETRESIIGYDVNGDNDTDDWVGIDECIWIQKEQYWDDELASDLNTLNYSKLIFARVGCLNEEGNEGCFNGGLIDDISEPGKNRIIMTASNETWYACADLPPGDGFSEWSGAFIDALHGEDMDWIGGLVHTGKEVNADTDGDGHVSMLEAWNYSWNNDTARLYGLETPWLDDNGDKLPNYYNETDNGLVPGKGYGPGDGSLANSTWLQPPPDRDLLIRYWERPWFLEPGNTTTINTTVLNRGIYDEYDITVQLLVNGTLINSTSISFLANDTSETVSLSWTPTVNGTYNVTSYVVPVASEIFTWNNVKSAYVNVGIRLTIRVPEDYATIQEAVDAAFPGYIIAVSPGNYTEHVSIDCHTPYITLVGADPSTTIIDGNGTGTAVTVTADHVEIRGFTIQNATHGIRLTSSDNRITGNIVTNNGEGILIDRGSCNRIVGNTVASNTVAGIDVVLYSSLNTISDNTVANNSGVDAFGGIALIFSGSYNTISDNNVTSNYEWGIQLVVSPHNTIRGNEVKNNQGGILVDHSDGNIIRENKVKNNVRGIKLCDSSNNKIYYNNFINSTYQVEDPGDNTWDDSAGKGNYWSDYTGLDDGSGGRVAGDGVGDTDLPHWNVDYYPLMAPWPWPHEIDITTITLSYNTTVVYPTWGGPLQINVTAKNEGTSSESFNVTARYENTTGTYTIDTQNVTNLAPGANTTLTFTWNVPPLPGYPNNKTAAWPYPTYTISANASVVPYEVDTSDNSHVYGTVKVQWPGDANGDGHVNVIDQGLLGNAWLSKYGDPKYDPRVDFNGDGKVNILDLGILAANWLKGPLD